MSQYQRTRAFIAAPLDQPNPQSTLAAAQEAMKDTPGWQPNPPENLHLTLRFIGDLGPQEMTAVSTALQGIAAKAQPFAIRIAGRGVFETENGTEAVAWLGIQGDTAPLHAFHQRIDEEIRRQGHGYARYVPYRPHVTTGRLATPYAAAVWRRVLMTPSEQFQIKRIALYASRRSNGQRRHQTFSEHHLGTLSEAPDSPRPA